MFCYYSYLLIINILLVGNRDNHRLFIIYYFKYVTDDKSIPICFTFIRN